MADNKYPNNKKKGNIFKKKSSGEHLEVYAAPSFFKKFKGEEVFLYAAPEFLDKLNKEDVCVYAAPRFEESVKLYAAPPFMDDDFFNNEKVENDVIFDTLKSDESEEK